MPYVPDEGGRRNALHPRGQVTPESQGELAFALTMVLKDYLDHHGTSFATFSAILGAVEAVKLEFYRRVTAPYEDDKITENGDVYPESD